jgi:hypothetical protein
VDRNCVPVAELHARAAEITDTWAVWNGRKWKLVTATSEKQAIRKGGKFATRARPSLPTRKWAELGRPCLGRSRRSKR